MCRGFKCPLGRQRQLGQNSRSDKQGFLWFDPRNASWVFPITHHWPPGLLPIPDMPSSSQSCGDTIYLVTTNPLSQRPRGRAKDQLPCYACALEAEAWCSYPDSVLHTRHGYLASPSHLNPSKGCYRNGVRLRWLSA